jgi:hypothetical protein
MSSITVRIATLTYDLVDYIVAALSQARQARLYSLGDELLLLAHDDAHLLQTNVTLAPSDECDISPDSRRVSATFSVPDLKRALDRMPRIAAHVSLHALDHQLVLVEEDAHARTEEFVEPFDFVEHASFEEEDHYSLYDTHSHYLGSADAAAFVRNIVAYRTAHVLLEGTKASLRLPTRRGVKTLQLASERDDYHLRDKASFFVRRADVKLFNKLHIGDEGLTILAGSSTVSLGTTDAYGLRWVNVFPNAKISMDHELE